MRALLIVAVLVAWMWCVLGAVLLPAFLVVEAHRSRRTTTSSATPGPPPPILVLGVSTYGALMAACAVALTMFALEGDDGTALDALRWAALPTWSALAAAATVQALRRRRPTMDR